MATRRARERAARTAPAEAKRPWWLIAVGLAAALSIAIATLPARFLAGPLTRAGLGAVELTGSVWSGHARGLTWRAAPLGDLRWTLAPSQLLRGRLAANVQLSRPDGDLATRASVSLDGTLRVTDARVNLPVEALSGLPLGLPRNWRGRLSGQFAEITVRKGWPSTVRGTLDMDDLIAPPPRNMSIGSYHIEMPDPQGAGTPAGQLSARVADKEGPFSFEGRFTLGANREFLLEGLLAPRGATPPALQRSLDLLGPPDAEGRRPVSVSGTL
jgi:general secretion pathway protein N